MKINNNLCPKNLTENNPELSFGSAVSALEKTAKQLEKQIQVNTQQLKNWRGEFVQSGEFPAKTLPRWLKWLEWPEKAVKAIADCGPVKSCIETVSKWPHQIAKKAVDFGPVQRFMDKADRADTFAYAIVIGNALKEAAITTMYTWRSLNNEYLTPEKRRFVGMYDLFMGSTSAILCLIAGTLAVKGQRGLINMLINNKKSGALPGRIKAYEGWAFLLPVVLQTVLIKRVIAPACGVPLAAKGRKWLEDKEAAKKTKTPAILSTTPPQTTAAKESVPPANNIAPYSTNLFERFQQKALK